MRKIKFRGKILNDPTQWVYGSLITCKNGECYIVEHEDEEVSFLVIPDTIGQYTGLKDKNGVEIYEGDIIKETGRVNNGDSGTKKVSHFREVACNLNSGGYCMFFTDYWDHLHTREIEVVGNIHDNPELLKVGEQ